MDQLPSKLKEQLNTNFTLIEQPMLDTPLNHHTKITLEEEDTDASETDSQQYLMCRICHCEEASAEYLISPCYCSGTLQHVHQSCLQQWLKSNDLKSCELCKYNFIMSYETRPFKNWEKLDMNNIEVRKVFCSITFHIIAITCVVWSLYVLIDRTAEESRLNQFDWSFWTKLVVVAIGFTGGVIFMYIQCKMYIQLCNRWRQYNRVIIIQPITEEILKNSKRKILEGNKSLLASSKILLEKNSSKIQNSEVVNNEECSMLIINNLNNTTTNQPTTNAVIINESVLNFS